MSSENRCDVDSTFSAERECYSGEPFVEMGNDSFVSLVRNKLKLARLECWWVPLPRTKLPGSQK
jgi:hypothetical protein